MLRVSPAFRAIRLCALLLLVLSATTAPAQSRTLPWKAAYTIAVHVSTRPDGSIPDEVRAIRSIVKRRAELINAAGGIRGHRLNLLFLDDRQDARRTRANMKTALARDDLIGMIGVWNSTRGATIVDLAGPSGVPFISEMSDNTLFADYANIFTMTRSVADEAASVVRFVRDNYKRPVFVGWEDDRYTRELHKALSAHGSGVSFLANRWLRKSEASKNFTDTDFSKLIATIREKDADLICLSLGSTRGAQFLERMRKAGVALPTFILLGTVASVLAKPEGPRYPGAMFDVAEGGIPQLNNERLQRLVRSSGLKDAHLKFKDYALGYGARYADLIAMIVDGAKSSKATDIKQLRRDIIWRLHSFTVGRRVFQGWAQDWSFSKDRASVEDTLIIWRPPRSNTFILHPVQYRLIGKSATKIPVLYVNVDMNRIYNVDVDDRSFQAEFYLSIKSDFDVGIDRIEFTNAYRSQLGNRALVNIRQLDNGKGDGASGVKLYKVAGRFLFDPKLRTYPFDAQEFSISFQPVSAAQPFLVQPPSQRLRRRDTFEVDGWTPTGSYVGSDHDIIMTIRGLVGEERIIPFYKFNYTWVMKRKTTDFMLRVVIPLVFILLVTYMAVFIKRAEFNARIAIQVTALLSAIALFLSIANPQAETATLSDKIFVASQVGISLMIGLSILDESAAIRRYRPVHWVVQFVEASLLPVGAAILAVYVAVQAGLLGWPLRLAELRNLLGV